MYFQDEILRESVSLPLNETYTLELPDNGLLSSLIIRFYGYQAEGAPLAASHLWRLIDFISQLEVIVNGATVVKSLTGTQAQFLTFMDQRVIAPTKWAEYSATYQREYVVINFGRQMNDKDIALDLSKFDSAELRIRNTATSTYWGGITCNIVARWVRDYPTSPIGYMRSERWRSWTTVANETKYLELPTELTIRRVVLQAWPAVDSTTLQEKTSMFNLMRDIELSLRTGVLRVFKGSLLDLVFENAFDMGVIPITGGWTYHTADKAFYTGLGYVDAVAIAAGSMSGSGASTVATILGDNNAGTQKPETKETNVLIGFLAKGVGYHNCGYVRFDYDPNPFTWLDPMTERAVLLNITTADSSAAAGGNNYVILDRLVRY
jgi:hypothetical protein